MIILIHTLHRFIWPELGGRERELVNEAIVALGLSYPVVDVDLTCLPLKVCQKITYAVHLSERDYL